MKIEFDMNNSIFQDDKDEEVLRILKVIKEQIEVSPLATIDPSKYCRFGQQIFDNNGNHIGSWKISGKR